MSRKKDAGGALGLGGTLAVLTDWLVTGGEAVVVVVTMLVDQQGLIYLFFSRLASAAPNIPWLPAGALGTVTTALALFSAAYALYRISKRATEYKNA